MWDSTRAVRRAAWEELKEDRVGEAMDRVVIKVRGQATPLWGMKGGPVMSEEWQASVWGGAHGLEVGARPVRGQQGGQGLWRG